MILAFPGFVKRAHLYFCRWQVCINLVDFYKPDLLERSEFMPTISANNNLTVQIEGETWSLLNGPTADAPAIVRAREVGIIYQASFATARKLPAEGRMPADQISMVVVGWAVEDSSWHLGIMVKPAIAQARGGRWCGLARWDPDDGDKASEAGEALAHTLNKPFRVVPPPDAQQPPEQADQTAEGIYTPPLAASAPPPSSLPEVEHEPPVPLIPLPISAGEWTLEDDDDGLLWKRAPGWRRKILLNTLFFLVLMVIFAALSFGAGLTLFAPVQPDWLPFVGVALTLLMALLAIRQFLMLTRATTVIIDNHQRVIKLVRGYRPGKNGRKAKLGRVLLMTPYESIEYVLVSQVMSRRERGTDYNRIWVEAWVHLHSPRRGFISVCYISQTEGRIQAELVLDKRRALDLHEIDTPAHHAGLYMAEMIGVPAFTENR
jgi:hypothetical protein